MRFCRQQCIEQLHNHIALYNIDVDVAWQHRQDWLKHATYGADEHVSDTISYEQADALDTVLVQQFEDIIDIVVQTRTMPYANGDGLFVWCGADDELPLCKYYADKLQSRIALRCCKS